MKKKSALLTNYGGEKILFFDHLGGGSLPPSESVSEMRVVYRGKRPPIRSRSGGGAERGLSPNPRRGALDVKDSHSSPGEDRFYIITSSQKKSKEKYELYLF